MIEILIDHSYEDDYFMISDVFVKIKDSFEKERIEKLVKKHNLEGAFVDVDRGLKQRIAELLKVDADIIDFDTNEIDLY
ncbi:hypothetical protein U2I54_27450 [Bacillus pseudomycoides]|uniref:Uncharacterized protein n=1 Tax=Bacillus bingmayongensis TaxID=1150157 RepID=A0ABU5K5S7_9BACI|nr:hypothetical protein [Bacillus pseudomycoides]